MLSATRLASLGLAPAARRAPAAAAPSRRRGHAPLLCRRGFSSGEAAGGCETCGTIDEAVPHDENFVYAPMFESAHPVDIPYKRHEVLSRGVSSSSVVVNGQTRTMVSVEPWVLSRLSEYCMVEVEHFLRPGHLGQLARILDDPEATENDKFTARYLLKNAVVAAKRKFPGCQDTGTAIIMGKRGQNVFTDQQDERHLSRGVYEAFTKKNFRYSMVSPVSMLKDVNTRTNLPAQIDLYAAPGSCYELMFMAKGGGSANKTFLFQQTKTLLNSPKTLLAFLREKIQTLGTSACPPYHLALVIGGTSAELNLKTLKLASARYYDDLPTSGNGLGGAYRDLEWEAKVLEMCRDLQVGAQFGGKYLVHDVRVLRLPRHGASVPVGLGVSCSADRQVLAKITEDGVFVEELEHNPARFLEAAEEPSESAASSGAVVKIDLNQPMQDILATLSKHPVKTRVELSGPLIVARDIAHARLEARLEETGALPDYLKNHIVYYAGPAKTPEGAAAGSFGPTTAGRMDCYVPSFQAQGASLVTLAKGNRSSQVTDSCRAHGGFYLGSVGGAAAVLASQNITHVELIEFEDAGMEAVWKIEVKDFPAIILIDDKGNDFFSQWSM